MRSYSSCRRSEEEQSSNGSMRRMHMMSNHKHGSSPFLPCQQLDGPGVLSLQSALVVAGGYTLSTLYVNTVEIFTSDTSLWKWSADPLPIECLDISLIAVDNTRYALREYNDSSFQSSTLCLS